MYNSLLLGLQLHTVSMIYAINQGRVWWIFLMDNMKKVLFASHYYGTYDIHLIAILQCCYTISAGKIILFIPLQ